MRHLALLLLTLSLGTLMGCQKATELTNIQSQQKAPLMQQQVTLTIGEQGDALFKR
jgi:hypothetical protein